MLVAGSSSGGARVDDSGPVRRLAGFDVAFPARARIIDTMISPVFSEVSDLFRRAPRSDRGAFCRSATVGRRRVAQGRRQRVGLMLALVMAGVSAASPGRAGAASRPNFLLIVADDLNWHDLGCQGNPDVQTPHIDRLQREGMTLRRMYTPAPTCSPARHALYTGLFPVRSEAYPNHTMLDEGTRSLFTHLKAAGYRVGLQAKVHVYPRSSFPFEYLTANADDFAPFRRFISRDPRQPWLVVYASHDPHGPWTRGPKDLYDPARLTVPPWLHDNPETRRALAAYYAEITQLDRQVGALLDAVDDTGQQDRTLVLFVSEQGSSFPYGGKWSLYENGIRTSAFVRWPGHVKPGSATDALLEYVDVPPTFLEAAGVDPRQIDTGCLDAYGFRGFDGRSFLAVLEGRTNHLRDFVFAQHTTVGIHGYKEPYPMRSVSDGRYKLICNLAPLNEYRINGIHGSSLYRSWQRDAARDPELRRRVEWLSHRPGEELYDLQSDPLETRNLAEDSRLAEVKARLKERLRAWMEQQGDRGMETELKALTRQPRNLKAKGRTQRSRNREAP